MSDPVKPMTSVSDTLFTSLERDFMEAMSALEGEESLGYFRLEYEKLFRVLKKSRASEMEILTQCQQLTQELLSNAAKMQAAVKLAQGDHSTIEALKKEIEKAWRTVDVANEKDQCAREMVKTLKQEIQSLQSLIQDGTSLSTDHTSTLEQLKLDNKRLLTESEDMTKQVETYNKEMAERTATLGTLKTATEAAVQERKLLTSRLELVRQEYNRERNARERAEYQCRDLLVTLKTREKALQEREDRLALIQTQAEKHQAELGKQQHKRQTLQQQLETAEKQLYHTKQSYNDSVDTTAELNERLHGMEKQIAATAKKILETRDECVRVTRIEERDFREFDRLRQQIDHIRKDEVHMTYEEDTVRKRIAAVKLEKRSLQEALGLIERECGVLEKKGVKEDSLRATTQTLIKNELDQQAELEACIAQETEIGCHLREKLQRLTKERENCVNEVSQVSGQNNTAVEELKMASLQVEELQRKLDESERRLTQQQAKYEHMRAERNQLSRRLVDAQDEIVEYRQRVKVVDHQVHQFKEELALKARKYQSDKAQHKISKERLLKARQLVNDSTASFDATKEEGERVGQEIKQLLKVVQECDKNLSGQQRELLKMSSERDTFAAQLIRRNDELGLLYQQLHLLQTTVNEGEAAYRDRLDDLRLLHLKLREIQHQSMLAQVRGCDVSATKERLRAKQNEVRLEQAKVAALSEELENPQNESRWRRVGGAYPSMAELESKMKLLQRNLLTKSEECMKQEMRLEEKQRLVMELRAMAARQPGPEVAQQLSVYQKDLQKKHAQMKQKASELNMTATRTAELRYEVARLRCSLDETRQKYYEMKVKNDTTVAAESIPAS
ncbi:conserved hypothetical protein [Leishmania braziliensis MHOM/BR/75/M2904]|uniref:Cilia- and flagella-associated protein 58 central coiled coil domain-containing protein n=1 Tax=Leishmania braziliensis TaxID=5660 RepID=A4HQ18_LEIBR|nr:conserved hypothetical protein [Leishmania braziliensis MHOM/BR/75/M2904]KAI5691560.1 hypothetical protein MNV84_08282 [Leishmania braziliensis]CAJ2481992.1 unnamed protein product [Leishmania braziliensis]CAJ2482389.1 unnamed protein product [Leishmania braziliensis]CAM44279.2 conserved hypothetical protein [Leishmania braziliensis MHOM/BR/75/M2904]